MNYRDNLHAFTNNEIGLKSSLLLVKQGVPQGSIVGPILFVVFISDLLLHVTNPDVDIYADDQTLTFSSRWHANISFLEKNINEDSDQVVKWSSAKLMYFRRGKAVTEALGQFKLESEYFLVRSIRDWNSLPRSLSFYFGRYCTYIFLNSVSFFFYLFA